MAVKSDSLPDAGHPPRIDLSDISGFAWRFDYPVVSPWQIVAHAVHDLNANTSVSLGLERGADNN